MKDWIDELAEAPTFTKSNFFKDGKGVLIVKDLKFISTNDDPKTFVAEFYVKESSPVLSEVTPNVPGTTVSSVQMWTLYKSAKSNSKAIMDEIIKTVQPNMADMPIDQYKAAVAELLRRDGQYTDASKPCPARGVELAYETRRQPTRDGKKELTLPIFTARQISKDQLQANRNLLDGR